MTRVIVAAGINNELDSKDMAAIRRLKQARYDVQFFYYLPKVPAEYTMIPSVNQQLIDWRKHAHDVLNSLSNQLDISKKDQHFVDEILGPDQVFDEASKLKAEAILTKQPNELKRSFFSKLIDRFGSFVGSKQRKVPLANIVPYVSQHLGGLRQVNQTEKLGAPTSAWEQRDETMKQRKTGTR
jgi:hypothetical protein